MGKHNYDVGDVLLLSCCCCGQCTSVRCSVYVWLYVKPLLFMLLPLSLASCSILHRRLTAALIGLWHFADCPLAAPAACQSHRGASTVALVTAACLLSTITVVRNLPHRPTHPLSMTSNERMVSLFFLTCVCVASRRLVEPVCGAPQLPLLSFLSSHALWCHPILPVAHVEYLALASSQGNYQVCLFRVGRRVEACHHGTPPPFNTKKQCLCSSSGVVEVRPTTPMSKWRR